MDYIDSNFRYNGFLGIYKKKNIKLSVTGLLGFYWDIDVRVADVSVSKLVENGGASLSPEGSSQPYPANVRHIFELTMNMGDDLVLKCNDNLWPYTNIGMI